MYRKRQNEKYNKIVTDEWRKGHTKNMQRLRRKIYGREE
jgi:hypothetical protein